MLDRNQTSNSNPKNNSNSNVLTKDELGLLLLNRFPYPGEITDNDLACWTAVPGQKFRVEIPEGGYARMIFEDIPAPKEALVSVPKPVQTKKLNYYTPVRFRNTK